MSSSSRALLLTLTLVLYIVDTASAETLCGGELVEALQFVCEDRDFYFTGEFRRHTRVCDTMGHLFASKVIAPREAYQSPQHQHSQARRPH
ncbi:insulin-like growth factor 2 [Nothobranchius furzeri]|uniref:insulin-like growth factor 2 n=1 Tax=Nothobranchius furzeri TaxID=105023 RepID=UPI003904A14E